MRTYAKLAVLGMLALGLVLTGEPAAASPGLLGYWKFDEGSGATAYDSSGNGNHGTLTNGPAWTTGKVGGALSFDGVNDHVAIPDLYTSSPSALTLAAWVKSPLPSNPGGLEVIHHYRSGEFSLAVHTTGEPDFAVHLTNGQWYAALAPATADVWHHIAGVWTKGGSVKFYLDGAPVAETPVPDYYLQAFDLPASIGAAGGQINFFPGTIDEARVYDIALNDEQIRQLAQGTSVGGIAQLPAVAGDSGSSAPPYAALAGGLAAAALAVTAAWYARRRWLGR